MQQPVNPASPPRKGENKSRKEGRRDGTPNGSSPPSPSPESPQSQSLHRVFFGLLGWACVVSAIWIALTVGLEVQYGSSLQARQLEVLAFVLLGLLLAVLARGFFQVARIGPSVAPPTGNAGPWWATIVLACLVLLLSFGLLAWFAFNGNTQGMSAAGAIVGTWVGAVVTFYFTKDQAKSQAKAAESSGRNAEAAEQAVTSSGFQEAFLKEKAAKEKAEQLVAMLQELVVKLSERAQGKSTRSPGSQASTSSSGPTARDQGGLPPSGPP